MSETEVVVREAVEEDVDGIREIFLAVYGNDYPYECFRDTGWLKRSVFTDDILMLVAEQDGQLLGTSSVVFDIGAHSDLVGEFGRLAVHPDARGRGVGGALMRRRVALIQNRLHVGIVENRAVHPFSQRISLTQGFAPVGFLPMKHRFQERESIALFARHFGGCLGLRNNHPRIAPELHTLAHLALDYCGLPRDTVVDEDAAPYPPGGAFEVQELTHEGLPALLRIARGRVRNREVFGPMRLSYGFFKLQTSRASYLIGCDEACGGGDRPVAGAVGYIRDDAELALRVFELITRDESSVHFLFSTLLQRCAEWGIEYVEVDVSAHAPRLQRTLLQLGFLPAAYVPAMVFHDVERLDVVKMVRLLVPIDLGPVELVPSAQVIADVVMRGFVRQAVLPRVSAALDRLELLNGLNEEQTIRVAGVCSVVERQPGERLFSEGEPADRMFVVIEGELDVVLGSSSVGTIGVGESVGEVALLTGGSHGASVSARTPLQAAELSQLDLAELTRLRPDIGVVLYRNLALGLGQKLRRTSARLEQQ